MLRLGLRAPLVARNNMLSINFYVIYFFVIKAAFGKQFNIKTNNKKLLRTTFPHHRDNLTL